MMADIEQTNKSMIHICYAVNTRAIQVKFGAYSSMNKWIHRKKMNSEILVANILKILLLTDYFLTTAATTKPLNYIFSIILKLRYN